MKKTLTALVVLCFIGVTSVNAQHDVRANFIGFLFNQYSFGYENVLSDEMSIGGEIGFFRYEGASFNGEEPDVWSGFRLSPEFRFYFNPDDDCEGFFVGPYLRYRNQKLQSSYSVYNENTQNYDDQAYTRSVNGVAISLNLGKKWVTDSGFYFSTNFGIGKYIVNNEKYDSKTAEDYFTEFDEFADNLPSIDLRYGLNIGWRFD